MLFKPKKLSLRYCLVTLCLLTSLYCFWQLAYISAKGYVAQWLLESAWQESQALDSIKESPNNEAGVKPWPWADNYPVAKLVFDRFNTSYLVLNNDSGQALAFGPGLSGINEINKEGTHVIFGHRDSHFSILADVVIGDEITIELISGLTRRYEIYNIFILDTEKEQLLYPDVAQVQSAELNLITCYPFTGLSASTSLRLVVQASEINHRV